MRRAKNGIYRRGAHVRVLPLLLGLAGLPLTAGATFVSPAPPAGVIYGGADFAGLMAKPSLLGGEMSGGYLRTPNGPTVGGARLPMALKWAGNAGKFVGRAMFASPGGLAAGAIAWAAAECIERQNGAWVFTCGGSTLPRSDGYEYRFSTAYGWRSTRAPACGDWATTVLSQGTLRIENARPHPSDEMACIGDGYRQSDNVLLYPNTIAALEKRASPACPEGWYVTAGGCAQNPPVETLTIDQMAERLANKPLPPDGIDWTGWGNPTVPIDTVTLNPTPSNPPAGQPMTVPQGNPVPVPNTSPQQYQQPIMRITPAPTATDPLRVDLSPGTQTGTSPTGQTGPETPTAEAGQPGGETPKEDTLTQCDKYPQSLGCAELDTPTGEIPRETKDITFSPEELFGTGSCPADVSMSFGTLGGLNAKVIDWTTFCGMALPLRLLVIALASIMAFFIIMPGGRVE